MSIELSNETGVHHLDLVGGEPAIFHCHHYNVVLQQSIEDAGSALPTADILKDGGTIVTHAQLAPAFAGQPADACLAFATEHFGKCGFGRLDLSGLTADGGRVELTNSHYALGFRARNVYGERRTAADFFACGFIEGVAAAAFGAPAGAYVAREVESALATGGDTTTIEVETVAQPRPLPPSPGMGQVPDPMPARPAFDTPVDEAKILAALATLPLQGNEEGLIPAFGVYLARHYANYYNYISYEFIHRLSESNPELAEAGRHVLIEAGHVCAFNTFGGIMESPEWDGLIKPMIKDRTDWIYGITSCINALGWGRWTVREIVPNERLVMRVDAPYEANYYLQVHGRSDVPRCYFLQGAVAGIMNLLYTGDITSKPTLDHEYYDKLFSGPESFRGRQTLCPTKGDAYCEIVVERERYV